MKMKPVSLPPLPDDRESAWLSDTDEGSAPDQAPRELYQRLKFIAGLLKDTGDLPMPGPYLLWRDSSGKVSSCLLDRSIVIGRSPDCDVVIDHPMVSRRHCRITPGPDGAVIEDLGSTHGTKVGDKLKCPKILRNGDVIDAGGVALVFVTNPETELHND